MKKIHIKSKLFILLLSLTQGIVAQSFIELPQTTPIEGAQDGSIAFADIDGDGDQDLLITGFNDSGRISKLYANNGIGDFTEIIETPFEAVAASSIAFADVDGDNDQDVFITGVGNDFIPISKLYINNGVGNFVENMNSSFVGVDNSAIAFADVDGDNDQDLLIAGRSDSGVQPPRLYINDGTGSFTELIGTPFEGVAASSVAFADVDGDNDQDVLITGNNTSFIPTSKLYINDGVANFTELSTTPFDGVSFSSIAFADVDGDNDNDVLLTGRIIQGPGPRISKLYTNDGAGNFIESLGNSFEGIDNSSIAFADVDGDNDQDVLLTGRNSSGVRLSELYVNDGLGNFSITTDSLFEDIDNSSIFFSDVDGDNDQDVMITGRNTLDQSISKLYINNTMVTSTNEIVFDIDLDFILFPNPVESNILKVKFKSTKSGEVIIILYNSIGRLISQHKEFVSNGEIILDIEITSLLRGNYFLAVEKGGKTGVVNFSVQ